uniref:Uncharacterized protein n=1 Tax=Lepeophtheirus salmonis TaxID=72036 RepID=A0A0K2SZU1_LEPSM
MSKILSLIRQFPSFEQVSSSLLSKWAMKKVMHFPQARTSQNDFGSKSISPHISHTAPCLSNRFSFSNSSLKLSSSDPRLSRVK